LLPDQIHRTLCSSPQTTVATQLTTAINRRKALLQEFHTSTSKASKASKDDAIPTKPITTHQKHKATFQEKEVLKQAFKDLTLTQTYLETTRTENTSVPDVLQKSEIIGKLLIKLIKS
jgi:Skp family chaperone for outer membrane proteins